MPKRLAQNYFNRNFANNRHKSSKKPWTNDFNLMDWTSMTLFDEYLEMGKRTCRIELILAKETGNN